MDAALLQVQLMLVSETGNITPPSVLNFNAPSSNSSEFTNWLHDRQAKLDKAIHVLSSVDSANHRWGSSVLKSLASPMAGNSQKVAFHTGAAVSHPFQRIAAEMKMMLSNLHLELHLVQHNLKGKPKQVKTLVDFDLALT